MLDGAFSLSLPRVLQGPAALVTVKPLKNISPLPDDFRALEMLDDLFAPAAEETKDKEEETQDKD